MRHLPVFCLAAAACAAPSISPGPIELAGPPGSGEPSLFGSADGRVLLTWLEPAGGAAYALRLAERRAGTWSAPRTVVTSERLFVNWADFPSVVETSDGTWLVHWLEKVAAAPYAYHVMAARSRDRGATWERPFRMHDDDSPTEHGFVTLVPLELGRTAAIWLDGRAMAVVDGDSGANGHERIRGAMTVRIRAVAPDGGLDAETPLDDRTCECCQTALARTASGLVAAYRDRSDDEVRDVVVTSYRQGVWSPPIALGGQGWRIAACPVNGPSLDASGDTVVATWFTAAGDLPRVSAAFSSDGGATFGDPIPIDDGHPVGRVDAELLDDGTALVIWLERTPRATEVRGRVIAIDGSRARSWLVTRSSEARAAGFPRVARAGDQLIFAWTETGPAGGVRVAAALLPRALSSKSPGDGP